MRIYFCVLLTGAFTTLNCSISVAQLPRRNPPLGDAVRGEKIRVVRERIRDLRTKNDTAGLRLLVPEAKTKWLTEGVDDYLPAVLDLCFALNSVSQLLADDVEKVRSLAVAAIDQSGEKRPDLLCKFTEFLQGDPEYASGKLSGDAWRNERRVRVVRWLGVSQSLRHYVATLPAPTGPVYAFVDPPPDARIPGGLRVAPSAIKDPVIRKKYEEQIATNNESIALLQKQKDAKELETAFSATAKRYVTDAYCKPPYKTEELEVLLISSSFDANSREAILSEVRRRVAERPEGGLPKSTNPIPVTPPEQITWRTDPRLRVGVTLDLKSPTVDDVIRELRHVTNVDLSRSDEVQHAAPALGSLSTRGVPAWEIMEMLAESKRVEGRWVGAGTGYRLVPNGTPVQISDPDPGALNPPPLDAGRRWVLPVLLGANLLVLLTAAVVWRIRARRSTAPPPAPRGDESPPQRTD